MRFFIYYCFTKFFSFMAKNKQNSKKEKGSAKRHKEPTEYQRERAKAKDRKKKNGRYGIGM